MPFTLSHAVAVIPLRRPLGRRAVLSALVIGSMVPDFHYFFPHGPSRFDSHSPAGLFVFCLPVGFATYLLFHLLVAPLVFWLAPAAVRRRLDPAAWRARLPAAGPWPVTLSLFAGVLTHLAWDAFTHPGASTAWWPALGRPLFSVGGYTARVYSVLQHASTAFGFGVLWWKWRRRPERADTGGEPLHPPAWPARVALAAMILAPALVVGLHTGLAHADMAPGPVWALRRFIWHGMGGAVRTGAVALLASALLWRWRSAGPAAGPRAAS